MFRFGKRGKTGDESQTPDSSGPRVSTQFCTDRFNGKYPHVGLFDVRERKIWVAKPLAGQAIRTSHARLLTGADNNTSTAWKDRFLCFWFYTPNTGEGYILGYPIEWEEAHLLVRIDPHWDYDRQRMIPAELTDQVNANLERQFKHGETVFHFFRECKLKYPVSLHYIGQRATDSLFYVKRMEPAG
jgi:hypothetical protein